jgi:hypothetical protein
MTTPTPAKKGKMAGNEAEKRSSTGEEGRLAVLVLEVSAYLFVYVFVYMFVCVFVCMRVFMWHVYMCMYVYVYVYMYM